MLPKEPTLLKPEYGIKVKRYLNSNLKYIYDNLVEKERDDICT